MGIGAAEGAVDAANIMKPKLARGELQVIGATTIAEYRKTIEKDGALARRFQSVLVEEPTEEQTMAILRGLCPRYEQHHGMIITEDALEAAIRLSVRYFPARFCRIRRWTCWMRRRPGCGSTGQACWRAE